MRVTHLVNGKKIRHAGILPWMIDDTNTPIFLLGKEHLEPGWSGSNKWSEFGGKPERFDLDLYHSAAREGYEESMGILGSKHDIFERIRETEAFVGKSGGVIVPYRVDTDIENMYEAIPILFDRMYNYVTPCMKHSRRGRVNSCPVGLFEKVSIKWFTSDEILDERDVLPIFRNFFESMLDSTYFDED